MRFETLAAAATLVFAFGCSSPAEGPAGGQETGPGSEPTPAELRQATYVGIEGEAPITLVDGKWEGQPYVEGGASVPALWVNEDFHLAGDLDGDGADETVAYLDYSGGGTGQFGYLAAMSRQGSAVVQKGIGLIGDRVQIRDARIDGTRIVLDVLEAGPDDGMCCPSQLATRIFALQGATLVEVGTDVTGTASLATLEGEWILRRFSADEDAPAQPELTMTIEGDRISGASGCNTFTGAVAGGETATSVTIGPLASTRRACPPEVMDLEMRYLAALERASTWAFRAGRLVVSYGEGTDFGALAFERR
ncbi:MAG TPA: META domain-containing protein [Vicinamibacterales bacterium]|nr:META domain-containing protein [Vicinamibacterales bacterium]